MLDDGIKQLLSQINASKRTPWSQIPLPALRKALIKAMQAYDMAPVALAEVSDMHTDAGLSVRLYRPRIDATLPILMYLHGGGWVTLSLDSHDAFCRLLAQQADCIVVSVDYRLAPEHPFPTAIADAVETFQWIQKNAQHWDADPARIGVGGDSAGGNLALALCQHLAHHALPLPALQCLIYPATDISTDTPSRQQFSQGFGLDKSELEFFADNYLPTPSARSDIRVSPLLEDNVSYYPSSLVFTAGYDPLRDEGDAMAAKLQQQGVQVYHHCFPDLIHGFLQMGSAPAARAAIEHIARALANAWVH